MKNLVQKKSGQCGVYNLANTIQDLQIAEIYGEMDEFIPSGDFELNEILKREGYNARIEPVISSVNHNRVIPFDFARNVIEDFVSSANNNNGYNYEFSIPFFLAVQTGDSELTLHAVSIIYHKKKWYLTDPTKPNVLKLNDINELQSHYKYINCIYAFKELEVSGFMTFDPELYLDFLTD